MKEMNEFGKVGAASITKHLFGVLLLLTTCAHAQDRFSFAADFLVSPNEANQATNRWQFFYGIEMTNRHGVYDRLPSYDTNIHNVSGTEGWRGEFDGPPYIGKHTRPDGLFPYIRVGEGHLHPGNDRRGVAIGFLSPRNGFYEVSGSVRAAGGGSINWYLDKGNGSNVLATGRHLRNVRNHNFYVPHLQLAADETVFLLVDNDGDHYTDSVAVDFVVRPAPVLLNVGVYAGITVFGEPDRSYRIEYIDAFQASGMWALLTNVTLTGTSQTVLDPTSPLATTRYYRAVEIDQNQ